MANIIFIPGNVPSLKNSKIKTSRGVFPSKTVSRYLRVLGVQRYSPSRKEVVEFKTRPNKFRQAMEKAKWKKPKERIVLGFHFVRGSKHKWDFGNISQMPLDLLSAHDFIEDDNMDWIIPMPFKIKGEWYSYNKEEPGVYIKVLNK